MKLTAKGKLTLVATLMTVMGIGLVASSPEASAKQPDREGKSCIVSWHNRTTQANNFTTEGHLQTVKFKVAPKEGKETCSEQISFVSFQRPTESIKPYLSQKLHKYVTKTYTPGVYTATVELPHVENTICWYQTDLVFGNHEPTPNAPNGGIFGRERMIIANVGGEKCPEPTKPEQIQVCDLTTKKVITINKSEFDETKHSTDMTNCEDSPAVLPSTGPADIIVKFTGAMSLTAATAYYIASRRQLLS